MPDNEQERGSEDAEVVSGEALNKAFRLLFKYICLFMFVCVCLLCCQEGSDHEEGEDADGEEEDFDMVGDETSDESDSEELEEKGRTSCSKTSHYV